MCLEHYGQSNCNYLLAQWCSSANMASIVSHRRVLAYCFLRVREYLLPKSCHRPFQIWTSFSAIMLTYKGGSGLGRWLGHGRCCCHQTHLLSESDPPLSLCPPLPHSTFSIPTPALPYLLWRVLASIFAQIWLLATCSSSHTVSTDAVVFVTAVKLYALAEHAFYCSNRKWD